MNVAYWIVAGLLAFFYLYAGGMKILQSREQLRPTMAWPAVNKVSDEGRRHGR